MTNYIFVDIDGPLLPGKLHLLKQNRKTGKENPPEFDKFAIRCFNLWAKYSNAQIVFSTNWALSYAEDELKHIMDVNCLEFEYAENCITPKRFTSNRHTEILDWLEDNTELGDKFIVVDDDRNCVYIDRYMEKEAGKRIPAEGEWINVDFVDGLTMKNFKDGCTALNIDMDILNYEEFGVKILTAEEKEQRQKDLELLTNCIV